jgi:hypothetical protein
VRRPSRQVGLPKNRIPDETIPLLVRLADWRASAAEERARAAYARHSPGDRL